MFLLFLITVHLNARIPEKLVFWTVSYTACIYVYSLYMSSSEIKVPSQKFPVPKITMQTKSHNLNFNVLSSVVDSSGDEV